MWGKDAGFVGRLFELMRRGDSFFIFDAGQVLCLTKKLMGEFLMRIKSNIFLRKSILFTVFYAGLFMFPHTFLTLFAFMWDDVRGHFFVTRGLNSLGFV